MRTNINKDEKDDFIIKQCPILLKEFAVWSTVDVFNDFLPLFVNR